MRWSLGAITYKHYRFFVFKGLFSDELQRQAIVNIENTTWTLLLQYIITM